MCRCRRPFTAHAVRFARKDILHPIVIANSFSPRGEEVYRNAESISNRKVRPRLRASYFRATLYPPLRLLLVPPISFPTAFLCSRHCGPIDTRRCRSNRFPRRLVRYIPDAITGSAICHAATPADTSEYPTGYNAVLREIYSRRAIARDRIALSGARGAD